MKALLVSLMVALPAVAGDAWWADAPERLKAPKAIFQLDQTNQ